VNEKFTLPELMAVTIAKELRDNDHCFIGLGTGGPAFVRAVGVPSVACELARRAYGKDVSAQYGVLFEPEVAEVPRSFSDDALLNWRARARVPVDYCLDTFRTGRISVGFISGAQMDQWGNVNAVQIGKGFPPGVRLVGPIAQTDHAAHAGRVIIVMPHEARALVEEVDYVSAAGFPGGRSGRARLGLLGGGPCLVVTDLATFDFDEEGRVRLRSLHPDVSVSDVAGKTGFDLGAGTKAPVTLAPSAEELRTIREVIDPEGLLLEGRVK
jgi:glutaconate CoA-transferase, subunit B